MKQIAVPTCSRILFQPVVNFFQSQKRGRFQSVKKPDHFTQSPLRKNKRMIKQKVNPLLFWSLV